MNTRKNKATAPTKKLARQKPAMENAIETHAGLSVHNQNYPDTTGSGLARRANSGSGRGCSGETTSPNPPLFTGLIPAAAAEANIDIDEVPFAAALISASCPGAAAIAAAMIQARAYGSDSIAALTIAAALWVQP